ncbi:toxin VasX [uncultured Gilliamella sp.]|uniref:toxin VasX n=1 Tax=uncultured Gilliamella sp. TaxID=1193505 RepID=UPI0025FE598A|nr:toxin VasX [uncultured Gilliamella sp.]
MEKHTTTKTTKEEQAAELEDRIIYAEATKYGKDSQSALANGGCGVCERKGFPIFLVRKAPINKNFNLAQNMGETIELLEDNREPAIGLVSHKYVYRTLRVGYVYILVKHKTNGWEFLGYEVTPSGVFRHKTITDLKERNINEIPKACTKGGNHHIPGSFINIDTTIYEGEAYIAYTRRAWSQGKNSTIEKYLKLMNESSIIIESASKSKSTSTTSDASTSEHWENKIFLEQAIKRFTKINLNQEAYKDPNKLTDEGKRSFEFKKLKSDNSLLELAADPRFIITHDGKKRLLSSKNFITAHKFNSLRDRSKTNSKEFLETSFVLDAQIEKLEKTRQYKVPVVIVEDTFGIAEELSLQRQLRIEPIAQLVIKSEEIYNQKIEEHFNKILGSKRVDRISHEETNDENVNQSPDSNNLMISQDYDYYYNATLAAGVNADYFKEETLHKRKTLSLINEYRNQIKAIELSKAQEEPEYDYISKTNIGAYEQTHTWPRTKNLLSKGYFEVPMTDEEKRNHLKQKNKEKGIFKTEEYYDVKAFKHNSIINGRAELDALSRTRKHMEKYEKRLNPGAETQFTDLEKNRYNAIIRSINHFSQDYLYYLLWLFGYQHWSQHTPDEMSQFNDCKFWLIECDTNCSNNHVGYVLDFLAMIDFTSIGGVKSQIQIALWDNLINYGDSIFYHLLDGRSNSFWALIIKKCLNIMKQELEAHSHLYSPIENKSDEQIAQYLGDAEENELKAKAKRLQETKTILQELEAETESNQLDEKFFCEKGELVLTLYSILISRVLSWHSNFTEEDLGALHYLCIQERLFKLVAESALVISGELIFHFQMKNIPVLELREFNQYFEPLGYRSTSSPYPAYSKTEESQNGMIDWNFVITANNYIDIGLKLVDIINDRNVLRNGSVLFQRLESYILDRFSGINSNARFPARTLKNTGVSIYNRVAKLQGESILNSIKNAGLDPAAKMTVFGGSIAFVKSISAGLQSAATYLNYTENLRKLEDTNLSETLRYEIKRDLQFGIYKVAANFALVVNEVLTLINMGLSHLAGSFITNRANLSLLVNGVFKTSAMVAGVVGVLGSAISIMEGFFLIAKGQQKSGATKTAYCIAGGLQVLAGVLSLAGSIGIWLQINAFLGPLGVGIFVLGLIAGAVSVILLIIFEDKSDKWDKMQLWFNRCLLGLNEHPDKGQPYLPTFDSMAMAINDFMVAMLGANVAIQLEKEKIYYVKKMRQYLEGVNNIDKIKDKYKDIYKNKDFPNLAEIQAISIKARSREIYLSVALPHYDSEVSHYEGVLRAYNKDYQEPITLQISKGKLYPILTFADSSATDLLIKREVPLKPETDEDSLVISQIGKVEAYGDAIDKETKESLGYFKIVYKMGEFCYDGIEELYLQINYWPQGKTSTNSKNQTVTNKPLVFIDSYKHHHSTWGGF